MAVAEKKDSEKRYFIMEDKNKPLVIFSLNKKAVYPAPWKVEGFFIPVPNKKAYDFSFILKVNLKNTLNEKNVVQTTSFKGFFIQKHKSFIPDSDIADWKQYSIIYDNKKITILPLPITVLSFDELPKWMDLMNFSDYFSNNTALRAQFIFNFAAPVYSKVDYWLSNKYKKVIPVLNDILDLSDKNILDIGCGTGAWINVFKRYNPKSLTGIDFSYKMIKEAEIKHKNINFQIMDAEKMSKYKNSQFDIVTASYVLHGMKIKERIKILQEMKRIASKAVVIHDFYGKTEYFIRLLELLERSDYIYFKKNFPEEIRSLFLDSSIIDTGYSTAFYIGYIRWDIVFVSPLITPPMKHE